MGERDTQLTIPKFDGDYEYWAMLMENLLRSKEWWGLIETGYTRPERGMIFTGPQREELAQLTLKDLKVKNYLFASIDKNILKMILKKETSKDLWDSMKRKYQGNERVQSAQLQRMRRSFEILEMKEAESISEYFSRVMMIVNDMRNLGEDMPDSKVVEKILRTLVEKFTYVVCAIEKSKDIKDMSVDGLQSSLMVHEQKLTRHVGDEHALRMEGNWRSNEGQGRGGYQNQGRGRGGYYGRGRGNKNLSKESVKCFKCNKMGHYKNECPEWEKKANYAELEEDVLLMAFVEAHKEEGGHIWFLDSGCSNHMCGSKGWFVELDETFRGNVKLGDDRRMSVEGIGSLRLEINGCNQLISSVYYIPGLKNNLISVGQLQQKGLRITIEDDVCEVWHKQQRRVLMKFLMFKNRMFIILAAVKGPRDIEEGCLQVT